MKIELDTYDPKYKILDIVYLPNTDNKWGIYLKIIDCNIEYSEFNIHNGIVSGLHKRCSGYNCEIMPGSINESSNSIYGYLCIDMYEIDDNAIPVGVGSSLYTLFAVDTYCKVIDDIELQANNTISIMPGAK